MNPLGILPTGLLLVTALAVPGVRAQWTTQTFDLRPGWNAVQFVVQPEPRDCDAVFAELPVESVWAWNRRFSPVEFIQDPSTLVPRQPHWLVYLPPGHPLEAESNLYTVDAGRCYLLRLPDGFAPRPWPVRGLSQLRSPEWTAGSFSLVGFPVVSAPAPRFTDFFSPAPSIAKLHRLGTDGHWARADGPGSTATLRPGEAFWAFSSTATDYAGPFRVMLDQRTGLEYGRLLQEQTLAVRNDSRVPRTFTLTLRASEEAPEGQTPVAGPVLLDYWDNDLSYTSGGWRVFPTPLISPAVAPGAVWSVRLAVRRRDMTPIGLCQSLLEVRDSPASLVAVVPVSAEGLQGLAPRVAVRGGRRLQDGSDPVVNPWAGLWVGGAILTNVSRPALADNPLEATAAEFQFRLLVHVDATGQACLLQKVLQMWQNGTYKEVPDPLDPARTTRVVDQPGRFVLVSDDSLISRFSGAALRDGQPVARRFSTVAFAFGGRTNLAASGRFGDSNCVLTCRVKLNFSDPRNPFVHRYHPDHDNLNERFETDRPLSDGVESWTILRDLRFQFTGDDPQGLGQPGWRDNQLGGLYAETITGLHAREIKVGGVFRLHRASDVPVLNDGLEAP